MLFILEALSGEECVCRGWSRSEGENTLFPYPVIHGTRFLSMNQSTGLLVSTPASASTGILWRSQKGMPRRSVATVFADRFVDLSCVKAPRSALCLSCPGGSRYEVLYLCDLSDGEIMENINANL